MTRNQFNRRAGFTLVEIMIVVAIIGMLAAAVVPNIVRNRREAQRGTCVKNLQTIKLTKGQWSLENKKGDADVPGDGDLVGADEYFDQKPTCPAGGTYDYKAVAENPTCSMPGHQL